MSKNEFLSALRQALDSLPPEERESAIQYYEDYFEDAGPDNEQKVIDELGSPASVAQAILNDYRELVSVPPSQDGAHHVPNSPPVKTGISPWLLLLIVLLAIPLGIPLLATGVSLIVAFFSIVLALGIAAVLAPLICCIVGVAVCGAGVMALFTSPVNGVYAIGGGLISIAVGLLIGIFFFKIISLFVPPIVRGFVNLCRRPFERRKR